jgi:hypothetical protein
MLEQNHKVYKPVREATGLKANHVCQAIRPVIGHGASEASVLPKALKFSPLENSKDKLLPLKFMQSILVAKNEQAQKKAP